MRKSIVIAVLSAACVAMLAGCTNGGVLTGGSKTGTVNSSVTSNTETTGNSLLSDTQAVTEEATTSPVLVEPTTGSSKYKTLNDWYVENKSDLADVADSLSTDEFTCDISCEGNTLIYTYTFAKQLDGDTAIKVSTTLYDALTGDEYKEKFNNAAKQLGDYVEGTCCITVKYNNANGKEITKMTYFG